MSYIPPSSLPKSHVEDGLRCALRSVFFTLRTPSLIGYVLLALVINGLLLGALVWWGWSYNGELVQWLQNVGAGKGFGAWLAQTIANFWSLISIGLLVVVMLFVVPTLFPILLNLNPITAILAMRMFEVTFEKAAGIKLPQEKSFLASLLLSLWTELLKIIQFAFWACLLLALNLLPAIGSVLSGLLMLILGLQFAGWSYITPYYEGLGYGFLSQRKAMKQQRFALWGLGALSFVPILNVLAILTGPVGGALLAAELHPAIHSIVDDM